MVQSLIVLQPLDFKTQLFCPVFYNFRVIEITETQFSKKIKSAKVTLLESKHGSLLMLNSVKAFFRHFTVNYIFPIKDQKWHHLKKKCKWTTHVKKKTVGKQTKKLKKKWIWTNGQKMLAISRYYHTVSISRFLCGLNMTNSLKQAFLNQFYLWEEILLTLQLQL